jgi:hypothetical protein
VESRIVKVAGGSRAFIGGLAVHRRIRRSENGLSVGITVFFACPNCALVYEASQVRFAERISGRFVCTSCETTVYSWSGIYDYVAWKLAPAINVRA